MGRAYQAFLLALTIVALAPAAAEDVPGYKSTYTIVRARFVPQEALAAPEGEPSIGVKVRGEIQIDRVLAGKTGGDRMTADLWLPSMAGPLDVYLLLETRWEGDVEIAAWSPAAQGFCIEPEQAPDTTPDDILRLRKQYPCKP